MIKIMQNSDYSRAALEKSLDMLGSSLLALDTSIIDDDLEKLSKMKQEMQSSVDKSNIEKIIKYLEELKHRASQNKGFVKINWGIQDRAIVSAGASIKQFNRYRIHAIDYVVQEEETTIVTVDYTEALDAIALEMVHKDIGFENSEIEKRMKDLNIFDIHGINALKELDLYEKGLFEDSKSMRVKDTCYKDGKTLLSYFNTIAGSHVTYKKAMDTTSKEFMNIVIKDMLDRVPKNSEFKLIGVYDTGFSFAVRDGLSLNTILDNIAIKVFGRTFEIRPKLNCYTKKKGE